MEPRRRLAAGLTAAAIVLATIGLAVVLADIGLSGGSLPPSLVGGATASRSPGSQRSTSPVVPSTTPSGSLPSGSPVPGVSSSPSASPSPSAHVSGFAESNGLLVYYASDGTIVPVQIVPGLRAELRAGKAKYYALAGNRYGLVAGSYAGEFKPNVTMEQANGSTAQTGGVVLVGAVTSKLIADDLAAVSVPSDRWVVALPVDITSEPITDDVSVTFDDFGLHGWSDTPRVAIHFAGSLPLANVIPSNGGYHVLVEQLGVTAWQVIDPIRLKLSQSELDPANLMNELLIYGNGKPSVQTNVLVNGRVPVGQKMLTVSDEVSVSLVVNGSRADFPTSRVLAVGDVPVFVASS
jgi:hypothetical protein